MFFAIFLYVYFADIDLLNIQCIDIMIEVINFMDWFYQNRKKKGGLEGIKLESLGLVIGISQLVLSCNNHRLQSPVWREFGRRFIHRIRMVFKRWRDAGYFANFVHSLWRCDRNFPQPLFSWEQLDIRARARSFFVLPRYLTVALSGPGGPRVI